MGVAESTRARKMSGVDWYAEQTVWMGSAVLACTEIDASTSRRIENLYIAASSGIHSKP
jgi:hypothetical protein